MVKYIILVVGALIVFPVLIYIVRRKNLGKWIIPSAFAGLLISIIGLIMQESFNPLYVLVAMFGLAFVLTVLLDKRSKQDGAVKLKQLTEKSKLSVPLESYREAANVETAASMEEDRFTIQPIEDDLSRWTTADPEESKTRKSEENDRKGGSSGE